MSGNEAELSPPATPQASRSAVPREQVHKMADHPRYPPPDGFTPTGEASQIAKGWQTWLQDFGIYQRVCAKDLKDDEEKKDLFLLLVGTKVRETYRTLPESKRPNTTFEEMKRALTNRYAPEQNVHYERHKFLGSRQEHGESTADYVTRLQVRAATCGYEKWEGFSAQQIMDEMVVDVVMHTCFSSELRKALLKERKLNLTKLLDIAMATENANKQNKNMSEKLPGSVHKVRGDFTKQKWQKKNAKETSEVNKDSTQTKGRSQCLRCGNNRHRPTEKCWAADKQCLSCGKTGHLAKMCRTGGTKKKVQQACNTKDSDSDSDFVFQINTVKDREERIYVELLINDTPMRMQIDTGADVTIMSEDQVKKIPGIVMEPSDRSLKLYNAQALKVVGLAKVNVRYENQEVSDLPITIVKNKGESLLGLEWLKQMKLNWPKLFAKISKVESKATEPMTKLISKYEDIFSEGTGTVKNAKAILELKPNAKPKFLAPRKLPFALQPAVEQEIRKLESEGRLVKVNYSDWGTPVVPVAKKDGGIRLCGDYKVTVNPQLHVAQHPLPNAQDMLATLGKCSVFSKIDLKNAFQQLPMDEESQKYCTLSTHMGLYKQVRLPYGIASSPAIWQQTMDKIFHALPGVFCFVDDILVAGKDEKQHQDRLVSVLDRIKENGMKIKKDKCSFNVQSLEYLGFKIDGNGLHKTDDKVRAVKAAKVPTNVKELQSFLGLVTFYGKFIRDLATIAKPLYKLTAKNVEWNWTEDCQIAFESIKTEITSKKFLTHYDENLPVKLVCDASKVGLGAVLAHVTKDGMERPIAYASRVLNSAEIKYSQVEKEALALVYGVKKFHMYLYGRKKFTLVTDHEPLLKIVGPKKGLPAIVAARLHRWAIALSAYNYDIEYRSTTKMGNADALSRLPVDEAPAYSKLSIMLVDANELPITSKQISRYTKKDPILSKILHCLVIGKDEIMSKPEFKPYTDVWSELSAEKDCIMRGARVVIPLKLRKQVLAELHADHQGIGRTKSVARTYVWWPRIDEDIEMNVKRCEGCAVQQKNPKPIGSHPWAYPGSPWQRLHIDFAGPFLGHMFLIVVDAYSKWPEVMVMNSTTSVSTMKALMNLFATHGIPEHIVSDNGPQFRSQEFENFCRSNNIKHTFSAPYHPATNGEAERFVQTFKTNMKCRKSSSSNIQSSINKFLLSYRTTPHSTTGSSPSYLLMGRRVRCRLDSMMPNFTTDQQQKSQSNEVARQFDEGDRVLIRTYTSPDKKWTLGSVTEKLGKLHYKVKMDGDEKEMKRHIDQLRPSVIESTPPCIYDSDESDDCTSPCTYETEESTPTPKVESDQQNETRESLTEQPNENMGPEKEIEIPSLKVPIQPRILPPRSNRGKPPERLIESQCHPLERKRLVESHCQTSYTRKTS